MPTAKRLARLAIPSLIVVLRIYSQPAGQNEKAPPDVLICKDGEKFIGHLVSANDSSVTFKSDVAGQLTVEWNKVQELSSSAKFAALPKGVKLRNAQDTHTVPEGTVSVTGESIQINTGAPTAPHTMLVTNVSRLVNQATLERAFRRHSLFENWSGGATLGIAYTGATQKSQSYTAAINLTRSIPGETWLDQRTRTLIAFNEAYGEISQPATPTTKTSITHLGVEQDWYLTPRLFVFVQALFDHNYSQGLDLQQDYGGGLGFVVFKSARQEFDVKASTDYINQQFAISEHNKSLIGSIFGETYIYNLPHAIVFTETGNYIPAWNNTRAFSALASANLTFPAYRHFGFTVGGIDNYLNDPPVGFKKNSFTLTLGLTYSLQ